MLKYLLPILVVFTFVSCNETYTPKPRAYARVELPTPKYVSPDSNTWDCPYWFEYNNQSFITLDPRYKDSTCWYNIYYPRLKASVHLTFDRVHGDLNSHIEQSRKLAMKHIAKATKIDEVLIENDAERVYGIVYDFKGETASDLQFFLTDSTNHFLRGSLYFNVYPNKDSLAPVIDYVKTDINHMLESFKWLN